LAAPSTATRLLRSQENVWEYMRCFAPDDPGRIGCNVFNTMELAEAVDVEAFTAAVGDVARRHEALRTLWVTVDNDPLTRVVDDLPPPVRFVDLAAEPAARRSARMRGLLWYDSHRDFDVRNGPLWSVTLLRLEPRRHMVAVSMIHLIADGWSTGVFLRDLRTAYLARTGRGAPPGPLTVRYADALAAPQWSEAELRRRLEYWRRELLPLPATLPFPTAEPGPDLDVQAEANLALTLPGGLGRRLGAFARQRRTTPFVLYLGAYRILLAAMTGWPRMVIGTATAGREAPGSEDLVGQFSQNLYVPTTIALRATLVDALAQVRESVFAGLRNMASFNEIAAAVNPEFERVRPWPYLMLYHAWFISAAPGTTAGRPTGPATVDSGLTENRMLGRPVALPETVGDRLPLWVKKGEPNLTVSDDLSSVFVRYNPDLYPRDAMVGLVKGYRLVLEELLRDPHQRISDLAARLPAESQFGSAG
jgi:Condensation domain